MLVLDGGMGRELKRRGAPFRQPEWSALALIEGPEHVAAVHADFIAAGADLITTNSYAVVPFHLGAEVFDRDGARLAALSGRLARDAADAAGHKVLVAGSLPPVLGSYRPDLFDAAEARRVLDVLVANLASHVDLWLAETQSSIAEARVSREATQASAGQGKPFWVSFTLEDRGGRAAAQQPGARATLRSGETVADAARAARDLGAETLLFNCSLAEVMEAAIAEAWAALAGHPLAEKIGAYANAFEPKPSEDELAQANAEYRDLRDDLSPVDYGTIVQRWIAAGATRVGGCCGIGPDHIHEIRSHIPQD